MGVVVAARHVTLGHAVAIKFLVQRLHDEHGAARFLREAQAAARIQSEHVGRVFDWGRLESGIPFMVMEYLLGRDLRGELEARGELPVCEAVDILIEAIEGVAEAHRMGIVHRDLKPSNIFLVRRTDGTRQVKVIDFGISKFELGSHESGGELTHTNMLLGSPRYMSPEQVHSPKGVGPRSDIWSLGILLHEMLAGAPPFSGETAGAIVRQVLLEAPPPIDRRSGDLPRGLLQVVARCLARDPKDRFADVGELALALSPFGSMATRQIASRVARAFGTAAAAFPEPLQDSTALDQTLMAATISATSARRKRRALLFFGGFGLLLMATIGGWFGRGLITRERGAASAEEALPTPASATASPVSSAVTPPEPAASAPSDAGASASGGPNSRAPGGSSSPPTKARPAPRRNDDPLGSWK
jgi:serine/threonine-protein kinase